MIPIPDVESAALRELMQFEPPLDWIVAESTWEQMRRLGEVALYLDFKPFMRYCALAIWSASRIRELPGSPFALQTEHYTHQWRLSVRPSVRPVVRPSVRLSVRPSVRPSGCPSVRPSGCPSARPSVCFRVGGLVGGWVSG